MSEQTSQQQLPAATRGAGGGDTRRHRGSILSRLRASAGEDMWIFLAAMLSGVIIGLAAWALKGLIAAISRFSVYGVVDRLGWWSVVLLPVVGILIVGIFQRYIIRRELYNGEARLRADFARGRYLMPVALTYSPIIGCAVTLGFGGSAGAEGPIAYSGAAIGDNIGRLLGISGRGLRKMMAIGAGAGIAAIFKAPVGGALFTLECLGIGSSLMTTLALFAGCVSAGMTEYAVSGMTPNINFPAFTNFDWHLTLPLISLGLFCGIYSAYYSTVMGVFSRLFRRVSSPWARNIISGLTIGILVFTFPALFGEGYGVISGILEGHPETTVFRSPLLHLSIPPGSMLLFVCFGVLALKAIGTASTNNGGGVAGDFAPTLFAGAVLGYFFARMAGVLFGAELPVADFAFYGMVGVMAGAIRAPLMAMFIVTETTMQPTALLPVAVAATLSYAVARLIERARR